MANQRWVLASRPKGEPTLACFRLEDAPVPEAPKDGQVRVRLTYVSVDPYMRGRMNDVPSYIPPFQIDAPLSGAVTAVVEESADPKFPVGTYVAAFLPWVVHQVTTTAGLTKIADPAFQAEYCGGVLGTTGLSALLPIEAYAHAKVGETVFVSGAAGAVGLVAVQIFKLLGCYVIASAGTDEKCAFLRDVLKADATINYKKADMASELKAAAPRGIDIFFDNVGGPTLDATLAQMRTFGRLILCGSISQYNATQPYVLKNLFMTTTKHLTMQGFIVSNFSDREKADGIARLARLLAEKRIVARTTAFDGFANIPNAFLGLFTGANEGKMVAKL